MRNNNTIFPIQKTANPPKTSIEQRPMKPMITITYDDESVFIHDYAWPVHIAEKVPGVFYIAPKRVQDGGLYYYGPADTWDRLKAMDRADPEIRIEIQDHSLDHVYDYLEDRDLLISKIRASKEMFRQNGIEVRHLAWPGGLHNNMTTHIAQQFYASSRVLGDGINDYTLDPTRLSSTIIDEKSMKNIKDCIDIAFKGVYWLILTAHAIHPDGQVTGHSGVRSVKTPIELQEIIQYAKDKGFVFVALDEGLETFAPVLFWKNLDGNIPFKIQRNGVVKVNHIQKNSNRRAKQTLAKTLKSYTPAFLKRFIRKFNS